MARGARGVKVRAYEKFLDERLRPELLRTEERRRAVLGELQVYVDLEANIASLLKSGKKSIEALVDIGEDAGVYCQAEVPDASRVFIDIGLGFHVECTLEEASHPIALRKAALQKQAKELTAQVAAVKSDIKFVTEGIKELLQLTGWDESATGRGT